jgi:hypothetical protein
MKRIYKNECDEVVIYVSLSLRGSVGRKDWDDYRRLFPLCTSFLLLLLAAVGI